MRLEYLLSRVQNNVPKQLRPTAVELSLPCLMIPAGWERGDPRPSPGGASERGRERKIDILGNKAHKRTKTRIKRKRPAALELAGRKTFTIETRDEKVK